MPASDLLPPSSPPPGSAAPPYDPPAAVIGRRGGGPARAGGAGRPPPGPPARARAARTTGGILRYAAPALLAYTGVRALGLLVLAVSAVSSLCAAAALFAIGDRLHGRRVGVTLAVLWAALPVGVVQSMAYSESLFTALAAWAVYAVLTGRWVWAGTLAALAGLTRPVGAAVVAAVWLTAAERLRGERRWEPRVAAGVILAPLGWVGLLAGVALVVWLCVLGVRQEQPLPLSAYAGTVVVLALCAKGYFGSKPRMLLPAFPLLLPAAAALARRCTGRYGRTARARPDPARRRTG